MPIESLGYEGYTLFLKSSSNLINTTNMVFSPENRYLLKVNISNLPANHENITLYVDKFEVAKIIWDHTNVEFNNITAKPGEKITLKATFKTSDNKLIPNGRVAFKINDKTIGHSNIEYGTATLNYTIPSNYSAKDYKLTTTYGGSNQFIETRINSKLHLNKINTKVDIKTEIKGNTLKININPTDENNKTITHGKICVKIKEKTIKTQNITGKTIVNFTLTKSWNNRNMKILTIYGENSQYKTSRSEITTKITLPKNKKTEEVKKETTTNNYYVSANSGSDTNSGTQTSPFKTIQKAINTVNTNKQPANIYLNGEFKGIGNTNLTVPGNLYINVIGVGNSSINGEVNYTIKTELDDGEFYWGSSPEWTPYRNATGNWAMNITKGTGLITINNLTIKNCWSNGGSSTYKTGSGITVNTGSTTYGESFKIDDIITQINGCTFTNNDQLDLHVDTSVLNLTNSVFNMSSGIVITYGTLNVTQHIINNTIDSPIGSSLYTSLSSKDKYIIGLRIGGNYSFIIDSNNILNINGSSSKALDLYTDNAIITNNNFARSINICGINNTISKNNITTSIDEYAINLGDYKNNIITENHIEAINLKGNSAVNYTSITNKVENNTPALKEIIVNDETFYKFFDDDGNLLASYDKIEQILVTGELNNKNMNINKNISIIQKGKFTSHNITIIANKEAEIGSFNIENTNNQPIIILNYNNGVIKNTNLKTNNNYTIILNGEYNIVENNTLLADMLVGDESVKSEKTNTVTQNMPVYKNYVLSENNFNTYFNNDGTIKNLDIPEIHFIVNGTIQDKNIILNNNKTVIITNYYNAKFINTTFKTLGNTTLNMSYVTVENSNNKTVIELNTSVNEISYCDIKTNANAINSINSTKLIITNNNITTITNTATTTINIVNTTQTTLNYNNITTIGLNKIISINIENITTKLEEKYNNILTQASIKDNKTEAISVKIANHNKTSAICEIRYENIITNATYTKAVEIENEKVYEFRYSNIKVYGEKSIGMKLINITRQNQYNSNIQYVTIILDCENSQAIILENTPISTGSSTYNSDLFGNDIYLNNNNSIGICVNKADNITIKTNIIKSNGYNNIPVLFNNSDFAVMSGNNIESLKNSNDNIAPIIINNSTALNITNNNITTTSKYTIIINKTSTNNKIEKNRLYSDNYVADDSVLNLNLYYNRVLNNLPEQSTYFYLNDKSYTQYFDDKGNLRDKIPAGITIIATGNLYNKVLNINKPLDIQGDGIEFINTTITITADNTNITGITLKEQSEINIKANNCNINLSQIRTINQNTVMTINGDNNTINLPGGMKSTALHENLNITLIKITGKNNNFTTDYVIETEDYDHVIGFLFDNAYNTTLNFDSALWLYGRSSTNILLNNSNMNKIRINQLEFRASESNEGIILINSSNNYIRGMLRTMENPTSSMIKLENNSNNNKLVGLSASGSNVNTTPIFIINSHNNILYDGEYGFKNLFGYAINITEGVGNKVLYNGITTGSLKGNDAVIQENKNDTLNNIIRYNGGTKHLSIINLTVPTVVKMYDTITINTSVEYQNGSNWNSPYVPVTTGHVIFIVNGEEIEVIDVVDGIAQLNYTLKPTDTQLIINVVYEDPTLFSSISYNNTTIIVEKLGSKVIMPNITSTGIQSMITAIMLDEHGNIIYDGNVTFKVDGNIISTVNIKNGIVQTTINTSNYKQGEHNITAEYNGNNIYSISNKTTTLTITKFDVAISTENITVNRGSKTILKAVVCDVNGNMVNTGRVAFKLNGRTLKDTSGNILIANVENGVATLEYIIPSNYSAKDYILTAVTSDKTYNRAETNTTLTVTK